MGLNINEIVQTTGWKKFMAKVYGWGAAVVLLGALFKIQHYPGAGIMLIIGLSTEAFIFFMSAFEPLHVEYDWTLAYPELAGLDIDEEIAPKEKKKSPIERLQELLDSADITPEVFDKLGLGLNKLNDTTTKMSDIANAQVATDEYISKIRGASESAGVLSDSYNKTSELINASAVNLSDSYQRTAESINASVEGLADSYKKSAEVVTNSAASYADKVAQSATNINDIVSQSGQQLANTYKELADKMQGELEATTDAPKTYSEQLEVMNKNLSALNAVYELQLQGANEHLKASEELYSGLSHTMDSLKESAQDAKKYQSEVAKLGSNLSALNTVYGNMLAAMNINVNNPDN